MCANEANVCDKLQELLKNYNGTPKTLTQNSRSLVNYQHHDGACWMFKKREMKELQQVNFHSS